MSRYLFSDLFAHVKKRFRKVSSKKTVDVLLNRRLRVESLEERRVLATVTGFTPTANGFHVQLSEQVSTVNLNLYDTESGALGAADVTLQGATSGSIKGSLVIDGTDLSFVSSNGPLTADTYMVTLRSAANAFTDLADGSLLDGESNASLPSGNGTPGGDFVTTFTVSAPQALVVSLPNLVRGPTQAIGGSATASGTAVTVGLPIRLSNTAGLTSMTFTISYDPDLLDITDVELGADAPTGSQVEGNFDVPGRATIAFFSLQPMSSGAANIVRLIGTVPEDATYGAAAVLELSSVEVNSGAISSTAVNSIQVVAFPGDVNANRRYDAEDARLIARVGVGLDTGFVINQPTGHPTSSTDRLYPLINPVLIGDVTGVDGISPLDASDLLRRVVNLPTPNIPALPTAQPPTNLTLSNLSVGSGAALGSVVGSFTTTDPDVGNTHTYTLVSGTGDTDNAAFTIVGNQLRTAVAVNQAVKNSYTIRVQTTDSTSRSIQRTFTISVTAANAAPTAIALSSTTIAENVATGTTVGTLTTTDSNSTDTHTYSIVSVDGSSTSTAFTISGNTLRTATALNFETKSSYTVVLRSTDQGGLSVDRSFNLTLTNVNEAPTQLSLSNLAIADNSPSGTAIGNLSTVDPDANDTQTYSLVTGTGSTDNALFAINGNVLRTASVINFATKTSYSVRVRTTDANGLFVEQQFTITKSGQNTAPTGVQLTGNTIAENSVNGSVVGTLSTTDANAGDTFTYTLVSGTGATDNSLFTIAGGQLVTASSLNFESKPSLSVRVRSTDAGGLFVENVLTVAVTNVNEAASTVSLSANSIQTGAVSGTVVGQLSNNDPDAGDTFTYALVAGEGSTDNSSFVINGTQLATSFAANIATKSSYSIRVGVTDAGGLTKQQSFTITVSDVNSAPTNIALSASSIAENSAVGTTVGTLTTADANTTDTHTYTLVSGTGDTDNDSFEIVGGQLKTLDALDFETKSSYSVRVRTTDALGGTFEKTFTIAVTNVNEAASTLSLSANSIQTGAASGTVVGLLSNNDPDAGDTFTYALVAGEGSTDNNSFVINGTQLATSFAANIATKSSYSIRVGVTDAAGLTKQQTFTITVSDVNSAPTNIALSASSIAENSPVGTSVGSFTTADANIADTHTYTLVSGAGDTDNDSFEIVGGQLKTLDALDFETKSSYSVRVRTTDALGGTFEKTFTITVTNVNEAAGTVSLSANSIQTGAASGTVVGLLSNNDPDAGDTFTYALIAGEGSTDNSSFVINGSQLVTSFAANIATKSSYSIRVGVTDAGGLTKQQSFTITVSDVNSAPTNIALSASSIAENSPVGTSVGSFTTADANATDTHTYTLVSGAGDTDNDSFEIVGSQLKTLDALDFETKSSYSVRVRTTDVLGGTFEKTFTIAVTNVNEAAGTVSLSANAIQTGAPSGTVVGLLSNNDPDAGDTFTYALVAGEGSTDNNSFVVNGTQLVTSFAANIATKSSYSVRVGVTDAGGLTKEQVFTVTVREANSAPTDLALSATSIAENGPVGTSVGMFTTTDSNTTDTHTYTLVSGTGDTDNDSFEIVSNQLKTLDAVDFETKDSYSIRVRTTDALGGTFEKVLTITVTNVNEAPTSLSVSPANVATNEPVNSVIGLFSSVDPDASDTFTYALVSGDGDSDNGSFTVNNGELLTGAVFDRAIKEMYSVRVRTTDAGGLFHESTLAIMIAEANVAPTAIASGSTAVPLDATAGTTIGQLTATDANTTDIHTFALVEGDGDDDNALFTITGSTLKVATDLAGNSKTSFSIRVKGTDRYGLNVEQILLLTVSGT